MAEGADHPAHKHRDFSPYCRLSGCMQAEPQGEGQRGHDISSTNVSTSLDIKLAAEQFPIWLNCSFISQTQKTTKAPADVWKQLSTLHMILGGFWLCDRNYKTPAKGFIHMSQ